MPSNNFNNKKIITISVVIVLILILASLGYLYYNKKLVTGIQIGQEEQAPVAAKTADGALSVDQDIIDDAMSAAVQPVRPIDDTDHIRGSLEAPVQLIVYGDFQDAFSRQFNTVLDQAESDYGDRIVVAFRHFPLRRNTYAYPAALAAECAAEQGKFREMHDGLFALSEAEMGNEQIASVADGIEMDQDKFSDCVDSQKYRDKIQEQINEADQFGVIGVPAVFINGEPRTGAIPYEDYTDSQDNNEEGLKSIIERLISQSGE